MPLEFGPCSLPPRPITNVSGGFINYINGVNELKLSWELPPVYDVQIGKIGIYGYIGDEEPTKFSQFELITEVSNADTSIVVDADKLYNYALVAPISTDGAIQKDLSQMCHYSVAIDMPLKEDVDFATMSWEEINKIAVTDYAHEFFNIGDTKKVSIDNSEYTVAIHDFYHDELTDDESRKAGLTLGLVEVYSYLSYSMRDGMNSNSGGWKNTTFRPTLQSTIYNKLPEELRSVIKNVNKKTSGGSKSTSIVTTSDNLFLFSEVEIMGTITHSVAGEGEHYPYYKDAESRKKKIRGSSSNYQDWWLRSPNKGDTNCFMYAQSSGAGVTIQSASSAYYTSWGFCI